MIAVVGHGPPAPISMPTNPAPDPPRAARLAAWLRPRLPRALGWLVIDLLIPAAGFGALSVVYNEILVRQLDRLLATSRVTLLPNDLNGTLWLYWWVHRALVSDAAVQQPDVICWPDGEPLGTNFPNVIDALLAAPFLEYGGIPAGFNAYLLAIPALGALAGYLCLRTLTRHRALAFCAAAFFGFNAYTIFEIRMGRPATALIVTLPLFVAAWTLALRTPGRRAWIWIVTSGLLAALAAYHYIPFALWVGLFAALTAVGRTAFPHRGVRRRQAGIALAIVGLLCVVLSFPYLVQTRSVQLRSEDRSPGAWDEDTGDGGGFGATVKRLWRDMRQGRDPSAPRGPRGGETIEKLQRTALPGDFLWRERRLHDRELELGVSAPLLLLILVLGLVSGRRARGWLVCTLVFWGLTLGPYVSHQVGNQLEPTTVAGTQIATPMLWLAKIVPLAGHFLWPFRAAPMLLLCLVGTLVVATDVSARRLEESARRSGDARRRVAGLLLLLGAIACAVLALDAWRQRALLSLDYTPWQPHPFLSELAMAPEGTVVIDLPLGLGEGTALYQVVHGRPRPEGIRGELIHHHGNSPPAFEGCLREPFHQALWYAGRTGPTAQQKMAEGFTHEAIRQAIRGQLTYLLIHPDAYGELRREGLFVDPGHVSAALQPVFGPPVVDHPNLIVFEVIPEP